MEGQGATATQQVHLLWVKRLVGCCMFLSIHYVNESTAGADASVEALKLYDMKLLHVHVFPTFCN